MPYITKKPYRNPIDERLEPIFKFMEMYQIGAGDFNYMITKLVLRYFMSQRRYQTACNIDGVLNNISKEFYVRVVRPYEDLKIKENGDLPEFQELVAWIKEGNKNAKNKSKKRYIVKEVKAKS